MGGMEESAIGREGCVGNSGMLAGLASLRCGGCRNLWWPTPYSTHGRTCSSIDLNRQPINCGCLSYVSYSNIQLRRRNRCSVSHIGSSSSPARMCPWSRSVREMSLARLAVSASGTLMR